MYSIYSRMLQQDSKIGGHWFDELQTSSKKLILIDISKYDFSNAEAISDLESIAASDN